jgi:hypothetical protein
VRWLAFILVFGLKAAGSAFVEAAPATAFQCVARTPRALYYSVGRAPVDVRRSEDYLARLETLFGRAAGERRVEIVVHPANVPLRTSEGAAASGITDLVARRIDTVRAFHPHELVHAAAGCIGMPPALFAEGLAVALSSGGRWRGREIDAVAQGALVAGARLEPLIERFGGDPDLDYTMAGSFVAFLLDSYGIEAMVDFLERCGPRPDAFEEAFRAAYGRTVAKASLAWRARLLAAGGSSWAWSDAETWPRSLQRPGSARDVMASRREDRSQADSGASILLSPEVGQAR